jgi:ornithine carbamoyltransferase
VAWIGDGNNVARSLAMGCGKLGLRLVMATPKNYRFDPAYVQLLCRETGLDLTVTTDPVAAVRDAIAVYTDVWASMGQETEREARVREFAPYQVNAELMSHTQKGCVFLHCLPARRGEEVTDEVLDGPQSVVVQQAGNRMHIQKGILAWLLGAKS